MPESDWNNLEAPWGDLEGRSPVETVQIDGRNVRAGDRVRLWPTQRADIMDMALEGKVATIEAIERDYEGNVHLAIVVDDDPGRDLGLLRQPGHRFFYSPQEVEPLDPREAGPEG